MFLRAGRRCYNPATLEDARTDFASEPLGLARPAPSQSKRMNADEQLKPGPQPEASKEGGAGELEGKLLGGRYLVESQLGRGGIGAVYLARDLNLVSRRVVVKVLLEQSGGDAHTDRWVRRKFREEVEALARRDHPGIVGVLHAGELPDGRPYIVMQYVEGSNLRAVLKRGPLKLDRAANIIRQIGHAIASAHSRGIVHRDLKPDNIMLQTLEEGDEHVKLIDFGIATVQDSQLAPENTNTRVAGSIHYMSPEQLQGRPSPASDIFAVGVLAYEMLTGAKPFRPPTPYQALETLRAGVRVPPKALRPDLPAEAQEIILGALSFDERDRPAKAREFCDRLAQALTETTPSSSTSTTVPMSSAFPSSPASPSPSSSPSPPPSPPRSPPQQTTLVPETAPAVFSAELLRAVERPDSEGVGPGRKSEPPGGAVPLDSRFYLVRPTDGLFLDAIRRRDSIVLVKGARQMGKTSLLARGLQQARAEGSMVVVTDYQKLNASDLESAEQFYMALGGLIADQLDLEVYPEDVWKPRRAPSVNFERYVRREVLEKVEGALVWGMDEVDRLFTCAFGSEVFGLFRTWHNERAVDPSAPWGRLTLAIVYATEAHLFIADQNQSPFNVGTRLELKDFTEEQVSELNARHGSPLGDAGEVERFYGLLGGHPYLVRRGLHEMVTNNLPLDAFEKLADQEEGPFGDHLRRILVLLAQDPALADIARAVVAGYPCPTSEAFYRLRSAGVMSGDSQRDLRPRCQLYAVYLKRHLF
jgi:serine/threonine protein kinase